MTRGGRAQGGARARRSSSVAEEKHVFCAGLLSTGGCARSPATRPPAHAETFHFDHIPTWRTKAQGAAG